VNELQDLIEFLGSQLSESALSVALIYGTVTSAVVGVLRRIPWVDAHRQVAAPVLALIIGQTFGWWSVGFDPDLWKAAAGTGLVIALVAIGGHSGTKNVLQRVQS